MPKIFLKRLSVLVSLIVVLCHTGCERERHNNSDDEQVKFQVTSPVRKDISVSRDYVCQIHAIQHIEVRALERGYLQNILVDEGKMVKKGQIMFKILPIIYQAEFLKAEAEARAAEIDYLNTKALADSNVVSPNELALVKAKYETAKAVQELARAHLGFTEFKAPFNGLVGLLHVRIGSLLEEGELLTTLSDNSKMWVYFNVPEAEYLDYKAKTKTNRPIKVKLLMANNQIFEYPGVVTAIESDFDNTTGNVAFRATFPNPKGLLRHGETGNIIVTKPLKNALLIPQKATYEVMDKNYVFVVDENNIVRSRAIAIGEEIPHLYVVKGGLTKKDKILLEGLRKVRDGDKINCEFLDPNSVITHLELYAD